MHTCKLLVQHADKALQFFCVSELSCSMRRGRVQNHRKHESKPKWDRRHRPTTGRRIGRKYVTASRANADGVSGTPCSPLLCFPCIEMLLCCVILTCTRLFLYRRKKPLWETWKERDCHSGRGLCCVKTKALLVKWRGGSCGCDSDQSKSDSDQCSGGGYLDGDRPMGGFSTFWCQHYACCVELLLAGVQTVSQRSFTAWGGEQGVEMISRRQVLRQVHANARQQQQQF